MTAFLSLFISLSVFAGPKAGAPAIPQDNTTKVVVLGGGAAGLTALDQFAAQGYTNISLYEAEDRIGGRIWTQDAGDVYYERAAELVNSSDADLIAMINKTGGGLIERTFEKQGGEDLFWFKERSWVNGKLVIGAPRSYRLDEIVELMKKNPVDRAALAKIADLLQNREKYQDYIRGTQASKLIEGTDLMASLSEALMLSEMGYGCKDLNVETLITYFSVDPKTLNLELIPDSDEKYRIKGGSDSFIRKLADKYKDKIHTQAVIQAVKKTGDGRFEITMRNADGSTSVQTADLVVSAIPAHNLNTIKFDVPGISQEQVKRASEMPFASNAKIFLVFDRRFWNDVKTDHPFEGEGLLESGVQFWETTENQAADKAVMTIYPGDWPLDEKASQEKLGKILAEFRQIPEFKDLDKHLLKVDKQVWKQSYAGTFNKDYQEPADLFYHQPDVGLAFVGSDKAIAKDGTIDPSFAYMDGAVHTGIEGVKQLLQRAHKTFRYRCDMIFSPSDLM